MLRDNFTQTARGLQPDFLIAMDLNDEYILGRAKDLADHYAIKDKAYKFGDEFSLKSASRIIFIGHGNTDQFGEEKLGAEVFADLLIEKYHLSDSLENQVTIDLIGCSINDIYPGFRYITMLSNADDLPDQLLDGVCYLIADPDLHEITLYWNDNGVIHNKLLKDDEVKSLIQLNLPIDRDEKVKIVPRFDTEKSNDILVTKLSELCKYTKKNSYARAFAKRFYEKGHTNVIVNANGNCILSENDRKKYAITVTTPLVIKNKKTGILTAHKVGELLLGVLPEDYSAFRAEIKKKNEGKESNFEKFVKPVHSINDIITAFDTVKEFKITPEIIRFEALPEYRQKILAIVTDRINELESEIKAEKDSMLPKFFFGIDTKNYKISQLASFKSNIIENKYNDDDLGKVIQTFLSDKNLATSKTYVSLDKIKNIYDLHTAQSKKDLFAGSNLRKGENK